jgi:hypothetical protein
MKKKSFITLTLAVESHLDVAETTTGRQTIDRAGMGKQDSG